MSTRPKPSPRELQVLGLLRAGRSHDEIAAALKISPRTLRSHIGALFRKLGVTNRDQLMSLQLVETIMDKRYGPDELARLRAERDELLEVVKDFVLDHDNGLGPHVDRLRNAIAKATGE